MSKAATTDKPRLLDGHVELEIAGEKKVLTPTLGAALEIGDLVSASERIGKLDMAMMILVVRAGLGLSHTEAVSEGLPEKVWESGATSLVTPLLLFLARLSNGGRPVEKGTKPKGK